MNHQWFEDMIFDEAAEFSSEKTRSLEEHLQDCDNCRSLAASFHSLTDSMRRSEMVGPTPGFSARWGIILKEKRERAHDRQILRTLVFVGIGLIVLSSSLLLMAWPLVRSPGLLAWTWVYRLLSVYSYMEGIRAVVVHIVDPSLGAIPLIGWIFRAGMFILLAVLWAVYYRVLTNPRRVVE